jgi:hypothetical protein
MGDARGRLIGEGREAEIFEWGDGRVLRLQREPDQLERLELEAAANAAAVAAGVPAPRVYELVVVDGRHGAVMDRVGDGTSPMDQPIRLLRRAPAIGQLQARLNAAAAAPELPATRAVLRERIAIVPQLSTHARAASLALLDELPDGDRLCHGDFHPGNVLNGADGLIVIDWANASRGDPDGDFARTRLLLRLAALPPTSVWMRAAERVGRAWFRGRWERGYREQRPVDDDAATNWETAWAAARLWEGIEPEIPALLALLETRLSPS